MAKRIDPKTLDKIVGTVYPLPYAEPCLARERTRIGDAAGLTQFGVNLLVLPPGAWSSQRHWHSNQDEFVYVLTGEIVLVSNDGEEHLTAGDAAGFKANDRNAHCLQNRSSYPSSVLEIGSRAPSDEISYPEIDLHSPADGKPSLYTHTDGTPYLDLKRRRVA